MDLCHWKPPRALQRLVFSITAALRRGKSTRAISPWKQCGKHFPLKQGRIDKSAEAGPSF